MHEINLAELIEGNKIHDLLSHGNQNPFVPIQPLPVSGLYTRHDVAISRKLGSFQHVVVETVRLDVDGSFPQMAASGTYHPLTYPRYGSVEWWYAYPLEEKSSGLWEGPIITYWPDYLGLIRHNSVRILVPRGQISVIASEMTITFMHSDPEGPPDVTRRLQWESPYFRTAQFEFDTVEGATKVTKIKTCDHDNHPSTLACEELTIDKVYNRVGVEVEQSLERNVVPLALSGEGDLWTENELNGAMRTYWSRYAPRSQWALWVLFAGRSDPQTTRGIMFDHYGIYQRQGLAVFNDYWEDNVPQDYPQRAEHIARMRFFTAVHEIGHCFNLTHPFDVGKPEDKGNEKSFMNYPDGNPNLVLSTADRAAAVKAFFAQFEYCFSNSELRHIRHQRDRFVEMGGSPYGGGGSGYDPGPAQPDSGWALEVSIGRPRAVFEFLEPVMISVTLTNVSPMPQVADAEILNNADALAVVISQHDKPPRLWRPYARVCTVPSAQVLQPGESLRASFFVGAGLGGWGVAEPGVYTIHVGIRVSDANVVANSLRLRVASPRSWDEELVAQDFLTDEVGSLLTFGGTYAMTTAIEALQEAADRLKNRAVALHALLALALPRMRNHKVLSLAEGKSPMSSVSTDGGCIEVVKAKPDEARRMLDAAFFDNSGVAAETFGPLAYRCHVEMYANWLEQNGDAAAAGKARAFHFNLPSAEPDRGSTSTKSGKRTKML